MLHTEFHNYICNIFSTDGIFFIFYHVIYSKKLLNKIWFVTVFEVYKIYKLNDDIYYRKSQKANYPVRILEYNYLLNCQFFIYIQWNVVEKTSIKKITHYIVIYFLKNRNSNNVKKKISKDNHSICESKFKVFSSLVFYNATYSVSFYNCTIV